MAVETWSRADIDALVAIVDAALPGENLHHDDVLANLFDDPDPSRVFAAPSRDGFVAGVIRDAGRKVGHIQLLAVEPGARRRGIGSGLIRAFEGWAFGAGAEAVVVGAGAPFYLFAGVDVRATAALCLFESLGYDHQGAQLNLSFPSRFRAPAPPGVQLHRVLEDGDASRAVEFVQRHWPAWVPEVRRGIDHGACHVATAEGRVVGFACHSVNRLGWLGPIGTEPERRGCGIGSALVSAIAKDVMAAGIDTVEVSWVGSIGFFAGAAEASVSRVFRSLGKRRPA